MATQDKQRSNKPVDTSNRAVFLTNPLFSGVACQCLERLYTRGTPVTLAAGDTLIDEGTPNEHLYFVLSGLLRVVLPKRGGRVTEVRLGRLGPGECIGEYSLLDSKTASASVRAASAAIVLRLEASTLEAALAAHPEAGCRVYRNLLARLVARLRAKDAELDLFQPVREGDAVAGTDWFWGPPAG
jgi:CRP-like cAMP-binding protein